MPNFSNVLTC